MDCNNNNSNLITIKVTLLSTKGEVKEHRRFSFEPQSLNINTLYEALALPHVVLSYTDSEGDSVSVRTQADLNEMLRTVRKGDEMLRMHATVRSSSSVSKTVKTVKRMAEPHIESAKNLAESAVESAMCAAAAGEKEAAAAATTTAQAIKKVAEEALVLGVRGYSFAYDAIYPGQPDDVPPQPQPQAQSNCCAVAEAAAEPPAAPKEPEPPLSSEFVKIEPPAPAPAPPAPVLSPEEMQMESLIKELALMGFKDADLNRALLEKNQMSIAATVAMLLDGE